MKLLIFEILAGIFMFSLVIIPIIIAVIAFYYGMKYLLLIIPILLALFFAGFILYSAGDHMGLNKENERE